ncbi:multifunctional CCA tRNA nucleotidyl transferase/2'3'-cyclic phosphodiesterase/2'nucleotidase/phosphatase [Coxiella endosymbiont of Amblyomma sculptum]|uniref:multifunctional CCA tRNA nucleotidyl transferase/2'3'-cyclic phosphodiesterase/2'nucleotidase/phosphatase n=1 Tax=Coxiella endosymbiont of Amblyomma sculptum TaxID=2487929 RepID=UPI00135AEC57|nr:multifunctional CCA tRNA nucleotidyl transferase/2'3'-cyclic phosphodiesterase/2'nucleotidase/phosphatase [Coxiella endosymbiont of Amblyomma sculptum]
MRIYLVGGAIRDELLGIPIQERDWVVVGSTPEEMIARGFKPVGKEFPVFLHPQTYEEYALARTEYKTTKGYRGFRFHTDPNVTLEEDLKRRDLTINAMAKTSEGKIIDPYGGQKDIKNKILRHVSPAFREDPVRILRLARLSAKFPEFSIHPKTLDLMKDITHSGEVHTLVSERVWQELVCALSSKSPVRFFTVLQNCGALSVLFGALHLNSKGMNALSQIVSRTSSPIIRFSVLLSNLPSEVIQQMTLKYRIPNEYFRLSNMIIQFQGLYERIDQMNAKELLNFILKTDALRRKKRFEQFLLACASLCPASERNSDRIRKAIAIVKSIDTGLLQKQRLRGKNFAKSLEELRLRAICTAFNSSVLWGNS